MSNLEQVTAIKKALDLSIIISNTKNNISTLLCQTFQARPSPPVKQNIPVIYPEVKPDVPFWCDELLPALFFWPWLFIYYFTRYKNKKEAEAERIRNTPEYRHQCAQIDAEVNRKQAAANALYQKQLNDYHNIILPKYEKDLEDWTQKHNEAIAKEKTTLKTAEKALAEHYEITKIVPLQYRGINTLRYIYNTISTSTYSVKDAIDMYDRERQRRLDEEKIYEQHQANILAMEQNDLLAEQNDIADRARREARTAAFVEAIQHHNTNKALNKIVDKK